MANAQTAFAAALAAVFAVQSQAAVKIVYVAPGGSGDGSSWDAATGVLADAYAAAADFASGGFDSGEVWVAKGLYTLTNAIPMKSGVTVRGGFLGGESDASKADVKNLTVISGDRTSGNKPTDDNWCPLNGSERDDLPIWSSDGLTYNPPNPDGADAYWCPRKKGATGNGYEYGFLCSDADAELSGCRFSGLTFTLFYKAAVGVTAGSVAGLSVSNCQFLACSTTTAGPGYYAAIFAKNLKSATVEDCLFNGCCNAISIQQTSETSCGEIAILRCAFEDCVYSTLYLNDQYKGEPPPSVWRIEGCTFSRCAAWESNMSAAITLLCKGTISNMNFRVSNCSFANNKALGKADSAAVLYNTSGYAGGYAWARFENCDFTGNEATLESNAGSAVFRTTGMAFCSYFRACSFRGNKVSYSYAPTNGGVYPIGSVFSTASANNYAEFVDCTFEGNEATATDGAVATSLGTITVDNPNTRLSVVNCIMKNDIIAKNDGGGGGVIETYGDIVMRQQGSTASFALANSILTGGEGYVPVSTSTALQPYFHNVFALGIEQETVGATKFCRWENVDSSGDPMLTEAKKGPLANWAMGVERASPYAKAASPVYVTEMDFSLMPPSHRIVTLEWIDKLIYSNGKYPWKQLAMVAGSSTQEKTSPYESGLLKEATVQETWGIEAGDAPMVDAFGEAREIGKIPYGPLALVKEPGFRIVIR